jgi:hypothetical protein
VYTATLAQTKGDCIIFLHSNMIKARATIPSLQELYAIANMNLDTKKYQDFYDSVHVDEKLAF